MISSEEVLSLLKSTESYRVERTVSTGNMDKFCEAICAFANDLPGSRKNGYLIIGAKDNGDLAGMTIDDALLKKIAGIRSDGNILPLPAMSVERFCYPDGEVLVAEVKPSELPPVRYRGRVFIRIGPRRDIATETEERRLIERRCSYITTFDAAPCFGARLDDLDVDYIRNEYLPKILDADILANDDRNIKEQLASIHLYDREHDCPTYAALILFGKNPKYYMLGNYVQFVRFAGSTKAGDILNERQFSGPLYLMLPQLESFVRDAIITQRPVPETLFRERTVWNYPEGAVRELIMNACMHRDYQSNMPIRLYQFDDYVEVMNAGGLYGEARPENFPTVNDYRNPLVAEAMRVMKYVNKFNRGIARVQQMLRDNNNPPAVFDVDAITAFRVTMHESEYQQAPLLHETVTWPTDSEQLKNGLRTLTFGLRTLTFDPEKLIFEPAKLNRQSEQVISENLTGLKKVSFLSWLQQIGVGSREKLILTCLRENPYMKFGDIAEATQLTISTTKRLVKSMQQQGFVVRKGATKNGYWEIVIS